MEESLNCPRCGTEMLAQRRGRATVNQCPDGHGVFLSRADLGEFIDAENAWHTSGSSHHTAPLPRITADMTSPPPSTPRDPAWVATLFN
ncbi:zf-TFIIB domain-containing protein [Nocardioides sp. AE5]|uniref:TFIIB-type zinc ribbon-containing protein n=1 Tax=Nocardioides sp. AE5 TaxID=2962573 RepID=UPI0028811B70|nr:zf-TFIIB domain-containing protein [Nocardioides sp. AE5]MDT0203537.1 zf-TFIIB domain-containing protein [Nocardioides sp. AE5]